MKYKIIFLIFTLYSSLYAIDKDLICKYLSDDLLTKRDVYDASHILMIPLEYSFQENDKKLLDCFDTHFKSFEEKYKKNNLEITGLNYHQYLHFIGRYLVLKYKNDRSIIKTDLYNIVKNEFIKEYIQNDAWQWAQKPFKGIKDRIDWKLKVKNSDLKYSYYNAIIDSDWFILSLGIDLYGIESKNNKVIDANLIYVKNQFLDVLKQRVVYIKNGLLIDEKKWHTHRDQAYSAYTSYPLETFDYNFPKKAYIGGGNG